MYSKIFAAVALSVAIAAPVMAIEKPLAVSQRIAGPDGGWDYSSVDAGSNRLFVARSNGVMTVDLTTGRVVPQLVTATRTHAAFAIAGTRLGAVTSTASGGVLIFDATTGAVLADIKTGPKPDAAVYDVNRKTLYVMDNANGTVTMVDPKAAKVIATITVGGALEFAALDGRGHLFVNVEDKHQLAMIDLGRRTVARRTDLAGCEEPSGLAYTSQGILIAACGNGVAKAIEAKSGKLLADVTIGARPDAVLYDAQRNRAYVPSGGDGTLTIIDTSAGARAIGQLVTQRGARNGAVDPATGNVYLPAVRYTEGEAGKPKPLPGSFEILVVTPMGRPPIAK